MNLRDYQTDCVHATLREWGEQPYWDGERATSKTTVVNLPTSSGKTIIAAWLAKLLLELNPKYRVLFVADREELIQQPVEKFHKACGIIAGVHRGGERASAHADVVVASIQTLVRRLPHGRPFTHIIDDEAHRNTELRQKIHHAYPEARVAGITATAFRKNLADLSKWYETVAFEMGTFDLIGQGYITPIKVLTLPLEIDISGVHQRQGDFNQDEIDSVLAPQYRAVAKLIRENEHVRDRRILAFLPLIKSSQECAAVLTAEGVPARHVDGSTPHRRQEIEDFERGDFQVLCNSQVFSTGVDFIRCDAMLNLACTKSRVEYRQRAGRIMRLIPGTIDPGGIILPTAEERRAAIAKSIKPDCLIIDLLWQTGKIGLAGPASLLALNETDEEAIAERAKKQRTPEELAEISAEVQRAREEELAEALAEQARRQQARDGRQMTLFDARELLLGLRDRDLINYEPVMPWETKGVTAKQEEVLEKMGINPDSIESAGLASKMLDAVMSRQKKGLAPVECFRALKAAGVEKPEECTLNDAIRKLGVQFPMTFGKKYRNRPLCEVPKSFWNWLMDPEQIHVQNMVKEKHPAAWRYVNKIVFPPVPAPQQEALPL